MTQALLLVPVQLDKGAKLFDGRNAPLVHAVELERDFPRFHSVARGWVAGGPRVPRGARPRPRSPFSAPPLPDTATTSTVSSLSSSTVASTAASSSVTTPSSLPARASSAPDHSPAPAPAPAPAPSSLHLQFCRFFYPFPHSVTKSVSQCRSAYPSN